MPPKPARASARAVSLPKDLAPGSPADEAAKSVSLPKDLAPGSPADEAAKALGPEPFDVAPAHEVKPRPPRKQPKQVGETASPNPRTRTKTESETLYHGTGPERKVRLESQVKDDDLRRRKDQAIFWTFLAMLVVTFVGSMVLSVWPGVRSELAKSCETLFVTIAGGNVGYFFGKAKGESKG